MNANSRNAWVTYVAEKDDLELSITLAKSLKKVLTRASLVVLLAKPLNFFPKSLINDLESIFDLVRPLDIDNEGQDFGKLSIEKVVKLESLKLPLFERCILLRPNTFVLRNCDELFEDEGIYFKPKPKSNGKAFSGGVQNDLVFRQSNFVQSIGLENGKPLTTESNLSIFELTDIKEVLKGKVSLENFGILEKHLYNQWFELRSTGIPQNQEEGNERIAVVGMSCRFPGVDNLSEFWDLLIESRDEMGLAPEDRWTKEKCIKIPPNLEKTQAGFISTPIDSFDSKFFGISPKEAVFIDPQQRILLEVVWESLEHSGIDPFSLKGTPGGVFVGSWTNDYKAIVQRIHDDFFRTTIDNSTAAGAARIGHLLGFTGPCMGTESDCASGMVMVQQAVRSLRYRETNIALACGVNLLVKPFTKADIPAVLSENGRCKTFDASADGFGRSDGCASLVLKRYSDAVRDGDHIWGIIRGTSVTHEGLTKSLGTPTVPSEARCMKNALKDGGVHPAQVSYVEAHGTGTLMGDPIEVAAIREVYGGHKREKDLYVGSVKANIGHTESPSGLAGMIKVILGMKNETIPPHRIVTEVNPLLDFPSIPAQVPRKPISWPRVSGKPRLAGISSFGIAGTDAHCILEEPPVNPFNSSISLRKEFERPTHIMKISARTQEALDILLENYKLYFDNNQSEEFADICHAANVGRASFPFRAAIIAKTCEEAGKLLEEGKVHSNVVYSNEDSRKHNICFLFTGQGSQYHGMGKRLYDSSPVFRMHFDYCENFLQKNFGFSIKPQLYEDGGDVQRTLHSQVGIFVVEYCLLRLWESWGITPKFVLGHSLGEFCAAVASGILGIDDALTLVYHRSRLIDGKVRPGKMLVVKASREKVDSLQNQFFEDSELLDIAAENSEDQTVVAGDSKNVEEFSTWLKSENVKCSMLQSTHAFHSRHMDEILEEYLEIAEKIKFGNAGTTTTTFISGMLGKVVNPNEINAEYWIRHTRDKVRFLQASKVAVEQLDSRLFVEVGPNPVLSAMVMMNNPGMDLTSLPSLRRNHDDWDVVLTTLSNVYVDFGVDVDWKGFDMFYGRQRGNVQHDLPRYPFIRTKFWATLNSSMKDQKIMHPLLGVNLSNPTNSRIFQQKVTSEEIEYLKDHSIGDMIVFPGAGYLEMLLTAGFVAHYGLHEFKHPNGAIQLTNFKIGSPLVVPDEENGSVICQTVVEPPKEGMTSTQVKLFHEEGSSKWIQHATGHFDIYDKTQVSLDVTMFLETKFAEVVHLKSSMEAEYLEKTFYPNLLDTGLKFGKTFRTLQKVWCNAEEFLAEVEVPQDNGSYLLHPTLIDGMIQVAVFFNENPRQRTAKKLRVSLGCQKFVWFRELSGDICYIYSHNSVKESSILFDGEGNICAALLGAEAMETRVANILAAVESQVKDTPDFLTTEWRQLGLGPKQDRFELNGEVFKIEELQEDNSPEDDVEVLTSKENERLISIYIMKTLTNLGFKAKSGEVIDLEKTSNLLEIAPEHLKQFKLILKFLQEDGYFTTDWRVLKEFEELESLTSEEEEILSRNSSVPFLLVRNFGRKVKEILTGEESALPILFPPEESNSVSANTFYEAGFKRLRTVTEEVCHNQWNLLKQSQIGTLRLLEIGGGTGSITETFLKTLEENEIPFEYVFTDISASFFPAAEKKFEKYKKSMKFRKLNLEENPLSQGFPPKYFDVVIGAHVVHATRDIRESLQNIRGILRNGGSLWLSETMGVNRVADFTFGFLDGYWRFTDENLRRDHPMLDFSKWSRVMQETGFEHVGGVSSGRGMALIVAKADEKEFFKTVQIDQAGQFQKWLMIHAENELEIKIRLESAFKKFCPGKELTPIRANQIENILEKEKYEGILVTLGLGLPGSQNDQSNLCKPFLQILQKMINLLPKSPPCFLLTAGQHGIGGEGMTSCENPSTSTMIGMMKALLNEHKDLRFRNIDLEGGNLDEEELLQEIFNSIEDDQRYITALRGNKRFVPKLIRDKFRGRPLPLPPASELFLLKHPESRQIEDLEFVPDTTKSGKLEPNEIEVKVICSALNFRDVFAILKPSERFDSINAIGSDFSGVVTEIGSEIKRWKVGDLVFGSDLNGQPLPSHVRVPEFGVAPLPDNFTHAEASCFPTVFATGYYALVDVAKAKEGQTVLIHTASGGAGLVAIQIARHLGLKIICTAGSPRKRSYLKNFLGISHVFHSRNTDFQKEVLKVTGNCGVDIVLNTLTSPGFKEASLGCLANNGIFIEMSKLNIWTEADVQKLRKDVKYAIVNLEKENGLDENFVRNIYKNVEMMMKTKILSPIPYTRFDAVDVRDALGYLQKTNHIGKVVISMPQKNGKAAPLFNSRSTYVITGGLRGIGLEVCKYMAGQGAMHIALIGRTPPSEESSEKIEQIKKEYNCTLKIYLGDVGDFQEMGRIFKDITTTMPPIRGVMHAAGTLSDGLIDNLGYADFQKTFRSKVNGTWNIHELTKGMNLEHFVQFSSFGAVLGPAGQASHVAACNFEDAFIHFRNSNGLVGTTINWGQWTDVGVATEKEGMVVRPFSASQGITSLDEILRRNRNNIVVVNLNNVKGGIGNSFFAYMKWVIEKSILENTGTTGNKATSGDFKLSSSHFWEGFLKSEDKYSVVLLHVKTIIQHVLHLENTEDINEIIDLQEMGVDSLMMLELHNHLQNLCQERGISISQNDVRECTTVKQLAQKFFDIIEGNGMELESTPLPTLDEVRQLVIEDIKLPEDIQLECPGSEVDATEIRRVLLTGVTGNVGSNLLKEMLQNYHPKLEKIFCLVRGNKPEEKLRSLKRKMNLASGPFENVVVLVKGDQSKENLGMDEVTHEKLLGEVDAVFHFGAKINHNEYYTRDSEARKVNVHGLLNVLQFACRKKTKHVFTASTFITVPEGGYEGWPEPEVNVFSTGGYYNSKNVCDILLAQATMERGIPCKTFNYPELRCSFRDDNSSMERSHFIKSLIFFMKEGILPRTPQPVLVYPMDVAVKMTMRIAFNPEAPNQVYNVFHARPLILQEFFPNLAKEFGYEVTLVEEEDYKERLMMNISRTGSALSEFRAFYEDENLYGSVVKKLKEIAKDLEMNPDVHKSQLLTKFEPDLYLNVESAYDIIKRDLISAKEQGLI